MQFTHAHTRKRSNGHSYFISFILTKTTKSSNSSFKLYVFELGRKNDTQKPVTAAPYGRVTRTL